MAKIISPLTGTLQSIKKQFIDKERLLKSTLNVKKKRIILNRANAERERFIDYENVLKRPLRSLGRGIKNVVGKRLGFLNTLKTFIVNVLFGFIALRLLKYLPQLIQFATTALKVGNFILDIGGKILNSLVTFVDYGYKAYDHARKIVGKIGGEKAISSLDNATGESTKLMNQLFIAAMIFSDFSPFASMGSAPSIFNKSVDTIKDNISSEVASAKLNAATNAAGKAALGPLATAGVVAGAGLLLSAAGEGVFQLVKWTKGLKGFGPISKFFQVPLGILEGVGTIFDILGAPFRYGIELIRAGFMKMFNMKDGLEKQAKNLGKFDARVRENIRRFAGIFAPVFTFFGQNETAKKLATPGSFGSLYGEKAVKDMGYSGGGKVISVRKYAAGGPVNIPRTEVKEVDIPRDEGIKQTPTKPGASIGGEERFAEVFPSSGDDTSKMDRYGYMVNSYDMISGIPNLGSVFALTTKTLLGDQVTKDDYDRAAGSLSSFMLLGLYETNPVAYQKFSSLIGIKQFNKMISIFLMKSMSVPLGGIISLLKTQVGLIPKPLESGPSGGNGDDCPCPEGSDGEFVATGNQYERALLEAISLVEGTAGPEGYRTMFGGGKFQAPPWKHPDSVVRTTGYSSAAAGKYQFLPGTWAEAEKALGLSDFSPANQDKAALWLAKRRGVNPSKQLSKKDIYRLGGEWAAIEGGPNMVPGGSYGNQAKYSADTFLKIYSDKLKAGGATSSTQISPSSPAAKVDPCICHPDVPAGDPGNVQAAGDPGNVQAAGKTAGGNISGYPITSGYGMRKHPTRGGYRMHGGVDIGVPSGKPIGLTVDAIAGPPPQYEPGYGNFIDIQVPSLGNLYFRFAHLEKPPNYKPGQQIPARKIFGNVGSTGSSTGPHIHFEVNKKLSAYGGDRDPVPYGKYLTIGRRTGGPTLIGGIRQLHEGEYVIDKDSVDLFGGISFFSMINGVENKKQRSEKSSQLIQHLSKYTGRKIDQRPEIIVENSEPIIIQGPPTYIELKSYGGSSGNSSSNYEQDILEIRA
jgi:murein DD-endopeptidase MepM/ murein hydrolase activator NlpD